MNENVERIRKSVNWGGRVKRLNLLVVMALVLSLVMPLAAPLAQSSARVQPLLLELAARQPDQVVSVIVQKAVKDDRVEQAVGALGAKVTKDLRIINAFAAEMKAKDVPQLAKAAGVHWISLDAPTRSTTISSVDIRISSSSDDAEEDGSDATSVQGPGYMWLDSSDLEMVKDTHEDGSYMGRQKVGLRFNGISIPKGATITTAYLRFRAIAPDTFNSNTDTANLTIQGEAADSATTFSTALNNISGRPRTTAAVQWLPAAWTAGTVYDSPSLTTIVQEVVNRTDWASGNSLAFVIRCTDGVPATDCGSRSADSWDGNATTAPLLHIEWDNGAAPPPPPPNPVFTSWATLTGTVTAMGFTNSAAIFDSALGPNGTFGNANNKKGAFGGFVTEVTPGNAMTKVEVVLHSYVSALPDKDPRYSICVSGSCYGNIKLDRNAFGTHVGVANAGLVYLDVTSIRTWRWSDFDNNLEVLIDHGDINKQYYLYYDAVGLQVTSAPGADTTGDTGGDASTPTTVVTNQLANVYNKVIRSADLWNTASKLQGKGVTVAVVDSGVIKTKDLGKRVRSNANFNPAYHDAADRFGHGTFVAGVIAGSGSQSGNKYTGVAPRAEVLNVRVSNDQGMSTESDVVSALQWVLDNKAKYNIRVVNLSLNSSVAQSYHTSPLDAACEILWFNGIVVVVAAGNNGTATLYPPANDPFVITVGATDDKATLSTTDDVVATFSAYGTTESGFAKPDLVAPGKNIIGLLPENDKLNMSAARIANRIDKTYFKMSGTSVSAPMVSGAVALLLQDEPNLTPDQVKYRLKATANKTWPGYSATTSGAGYLDIYAAVNGTTTQSANTGITASQLLWTGSNPVNWGSVQWGSVQWGSVQWGSVQWGSVQWGSDYWGP